MSSLITLKPELMSGLSVYISRSFVACSQFVIRKSLLSNAQLFVDAATTQSLSQTFGADTPPMESVDDQEDSMFLYYFSQDKDLGKARMKLTRTPWYISDAEGDGVLFTSDDGQPYIFERALVDLFNLNTLYRVDAPTPDDAAVFTDVATPDVDGNFIVSACDVKLPDRPNIAAWKEKAEKSGKKLKKAAEPVTSAEQPPLPVSGAPSMPPVEEAIASDDAESEDSLGPTTIG